MTSSIILEAKSIAGNIYAGNAGSATYYAFSHNGKKICYGEYIYPNEENRLNFENFDGCINMKTRQCTEFTIKGNKTF
jgi:hypothetical protein